MVSKIGGDVIVNLKITSCSNVCFLKQNGIKQKMAQVQTQEKTLLKRLISSGSISAVNGSTGMKVGVGMACASMLLIPKGICRSSEHLLLRNKHMLCSACSSGLVGCSGKGWDPCYVQTVQERGTLGLEPRLLCALDLQCNHKENIKAS